MHAWRIWTRGGVELGVQLVQQPRECTAPGSTTTGMLCQEVLTKLTPCGNCNCMAPPSAAVAAAHLAALQANTPRIHTGVTAPIHDKMFASHLGSLTAWSHLPSAAWLEAPAASKSLEHSSLTPENKCWSAGVACDFSASAAHFRRRACSWAVRPAFWWCCCWEESKRYLTTSWFMI